MWDLLNNVYLDSIVLRYISKCVSLFLGYIISKLLWLFGLLLLLLLWGFVHEKYMAALQLLISLVFFFLLLLLLFLFYCSGCNFASYHCRHCSCSMEFLSRSTAGDVPLVAFGGSDGVIRVLSMMTWKVWHFNIAVLSQLIAVLIELLWHSTHFLQLVRRYTGGHKGSISCLMTFMASSGEVDLLLYGMKFGHHIP